jgi:hypothetical protein
MQEIEGMEGGGMFKTRHTPEELTQMPNEELDTLVERLVIGTRPEPGIIHRIRKSWAKMVMRRDPSRGCAPHTISREGWGGFGWDSDLPEYSGSYEGMGLIIEKMQGRGYTITIEPGDRVRFTKDGKETKYSLMKWDIDLTKTVAIAAVLAVQ